MCDIPVVPVLHMSYHCREIGSFEESCLKILSCEFNCCTCNTKSTMCQSPESSAWCVQLGGNGWCADVPVVLSVSVGVSNLSRLVFNCWICWARLSHFVGDGFRRQFFTALFL
jgi:hypothetical protein